VTINTYFQAGAGTDKQPQRLGDERRLCAQREEHDEPQKVVGLIRHPVDDRSVQHRKYDLHRSTAICIDNFRLM